MTVWIYVDTNKQLGDRDHLKVFANRDAAETWFEENDPEGVAFEYEVLRPKAKGKQLPQSTPSPELPDDALIEGLNLPTRIRNALINAGFKTVGDVRESSDKTLFSFQRI